MNQKKCTIILILLLSFGLVQAQVDTTITLQPGPSDGIDVPVFGNSPNANPDKSPEFISFNWDFGNGRYIGYSLMRFKMPDLKGKYELVSAHLSLYHNGTSGSAGHVGGNSCYLSNVKDPWEEEKVNWKTRPSITSENRVTLKKSALKNEDYENIDISGLAKEWVKDPARNYGMMLHIVDESASNKGSSLKFSSSDHTNASKRPKLVLKYREKEDVKTHDTCLAIVPGPKNGKDALIYEDRANNSNYNTPEFITYNWDFGSSVAEGYSVIQFDLPDVGSSYVLQSAKLSLYHNSTSSSAGQEGNNASHLLRITSSWEQDKVSWNNMPTTTDDDKVYIPKSANSTQDYENIDLTDFVNVWLDDPKSNHGMMLKIIDNNTKNNSMKFSSSNHKDSLKRPKLELCFNLRVGTENEVSNSFSIYPNPNNGHFDVDLGAFKSNVKMIRILNIQGQTIQTRQDLGTSEKTVSMNISDYDPGVYFVQVIGQNSISTKKIVNQ